MGEELFQINEEFPNHITGDLNRNRWMILDDLSSEHGGLTIGISDQQHDHTPIACGEVRHCWGFLWW